MSDLNWAKPVFSAEVTPSAAYLQRLQEFLSQQQQSSTGGTKRKAGQDSDKSDRSAANSSLKDRRHSTNNGSDVPEHHHNDEDSAGDTSFTAKPGRSAKASTSDKRKEQNRNAQRAFRERKEKVVKDLEEKVSELTKVADDKDAENQNLKDLVARLQQENARLQQSGSASVPSFPSQSFDFSFTGPPMPTQVAPNSREASSSRSQSPTSTLQIQNPQQLFNGMTDDQILAYLSQPVATSSQPQNTYELIQAPMPQSMGDDFMWNSSAFGTEIPQAAPADVTNLLEKYGSSTSALNANSAPSLSPVNGPFSADSVNGVSPSSWPSMTSSHTTPTSGSMPVRQPSSEEKSSPFAGISPLSGAPARSSSSDDAEATTRMYNAVFERMLQQQQAISPPAVGSSVASTSTSVSGVQQRNLVKQAVARSSGSLNGNAQAADSPDTTCSSSGTEPSTCSSDLLPGTPSNGMVCNCPPGNKAGNATSSDSMRGNYGSAFSNFSDPANTAFGGMFASGLNSSKNVQDIYASMFGGTEATTPSGVFDAMNYRDPLFADTTSGSKYASETLNINDYLVASPPSMQPEGSQGSELQFMRPESSSSSVPTLSTTSSSASPVLAPSSGASGIVYSSNPSDYLPHQVTYGDPLIQHVMKPSWDAQKALHGGPDFEIDSLCKDMRMKATCTEVARQRIANSIASDETTMKLYEQYLKNAGAASAGNSQ